MVNEGKKKMLRGKVTIHGTDNLGKIEVFVFWKIRNAGHTHHP